MPTSPTNITELWDRLTPFMQRHDTLLEVIAERTQEHSEILLSLPPSVTDHEDRISRLERAVARLQFRKS